jgi:hypothetical protein
VLENTAEKKALLLAKDHVGRTPLHLSCDNLITDTQILRLLVESARKEGILSELINQKDNYTGSNTCVLVSGKDKGRPAYHYVHSRRETVALFEKRVGSGIVDVSSFGEVVKSGWGDYPPDEIIKEVDEALIKKAKVKPLVDATALHMAVYREKTEFVKLLAESGADVNATDRFGMTPLHLAAMRGNVDILKILIDNKGCLEITDKKDRTPLDVAMLNEQNNAATHMKEKVTLDIYQSLKVKVNQRFAGVQQNPDPLEGKSDDVRQSVIDALRGLIVDISEILDDMENPQRDGWVMVKHEN